MARYLRLFKIVVSHEYFAGRSAGLRFAPTAACEALMRGEGLLLRQTEQGAELWQEQQEPQEQPLRPAEPLALAFEVFSADPQLQFCTDWPVAPPLRFVGAHADAPLQAETLAGSGASRKPLFSVEIAHRGGPRDGADVPTYRIALAAKKIHWKYFFSGSLAARKLRIVDLDAAPGAAGIGFAASAMPPGPAGSAYTSEAALPMQRLPQQRLQLREEGGAGKVLIKRLPNANIEKLGKERGRDGLSMIVAEIYIHQ
jgi:hypothetical protein